MRLGDDSKHDLSLFSCSSVKLSREISISASFGVSLIAWQRSSKHGGRIVQLSNLIDSIPLLPRTISVIYAILSCVMSSEWKRSSEMDLFLAIPSEIVVQFDLSHFDSDISIERIIVLDFSNFLKRFGSTSNGILSANRL